MYDEIEIKSGCSYSQCIKREYTVIPFSSRYRNGDVIENRVADKRNWAICLAYRDRSNL